MNRATELALLVLLGGCASSGPAEPVGAGGVVAHLLDQAVTEGTEYLIEPFEPVGGIEAETVPVEVIGGAVGDDGTVAVVFATWSEADPGALAVLRSGPQGTEVVALGAATPGTGEIANVAVVAGTVVVWTCSIAQRVFVLPPGATDALEFPPPGPFCHQGLHEANGELMGAFTNGVDYDIRTWAVSPPGFEEVAVESLPAHGTTWALEVGRRGAEPYVVGTGGFDVRYIDAAGVVTQDANDAMLVRDGQDWLVIHGSYGYDGPTGPDELHAWSPTAGTWEPRGTVDAVPTELRRVTGAGHFGVERVQWGVDERVTVVTEASWLAPVDGGYGAVPIPHGPCDDPEACARIGEWWPAWVIDRPGDRRAVWILWSWFGAAAVIASPF